MKTNTFIFNFIKPARLIYDLNIPPDITEGGRALGVSGASLENTVDPVKELQEARAKAKFAAEAAKKELRDPWAGEEDKKAGSDIVAINDIADPWGPTKGNVEEIFKAKSYEARRLLADFAGSASGKVDYSKWNERILGILGKNNETAENKRNWLKAFQEWVGTKVDFAVGPKTMAKLALKMDMGEYGNRIEGTMIARRDKKTSSKSVPPSVEQNTTVASGKAYSEKPKPDVFGADSIPSPAVTKNEQSIDTNKKVAVVAKKIYTEQSKPEVFEPGNIPEPGQTKYEQFSNEGAVVAATGVDADSDAIDTDIVAADESEPKRPAGVYRNKAKPDEIASYDTNEAPEGWVMMTKDEEDEVIASAYDNQQANKQG